MHRFSFVIFISLLPLLSLSAREKRVRCEGTFEYTFATSVSMDKAAEQAIQYAITDAMAQNPEIGTIVSSQSLRVATLEKEFFYQHANLLVKGRLVKNIKQPVVSAPIFYDNNKLFYISATVCFDAELLTYPPTKFSVKALRNGTEDKHEADVFKNGDQICISFQSPKKGYMAIFYDDADSVECMMPLVGNDDAPFPIAKDTRYVFFDTSEDYYTTDCGEEPEIMKLHVLFSPNKFIDGDLIRRKSVKNFNNWVDELRGYDNQLQYQPLLIEIDPEER